MQIHKARKEDIEFISQSVLKIFLYESEIHTKISPPTKGFLQEFSKELQKKILSQEHIFLVYTRKGVSIGFISGYIKRPANIWSYHKFCYIDAIFVEPDYRKQGIAQKLFSEYTQWALRQGADKILLDVLPENEAAFSLYKKLGFSFHMMTLGKDISS